MSGLHFLLRLAKRIWTGRVSEPHQLELPLRFEK